MTDTTMSTTTPGFVQTDSGHNHGMDRDILHAVHHGAESVKDSVERFGITEIQANQKGFTDLSVDVEKTAAANGVAIQATAAATQVAIEKIGAASEIAFKENLFELAKLNGQNELEAAKQFAHVNLLQEKNFAETNLRNEKLFSELALRNERDTRSIELQADRLAASSALAAATNTAAIQSANADCCCEIKSLIRDDGQKTRDLINQIQALNNSVALQDAKNEVNLLKIKFATTTTV